MILAIVGTALLFGVAISGCNRNRDTRSTASTRRPVKNTKRQERDLAQAPTVRPAEVLAASVKRPQRRGPAGPGAQPYQQRRQPTMQHDYYQPLPVAAQTGYELARAYEPLPEPVPVASLYNQSGMSEVYTLSDTGVPMYQTENYAPAYGAYTQPAPYYEPPRVVHPSPELAMARATLPPPPSAGPIYAQPAQPAAFVPPIEPQMFHAPIPELEPVRYQRVAQQQPPMPLMSGPVRQQHVPQLAPIATQTNYETRRALEPLAQPAPAAQGWIPSPATAMGGRGF